MRAALFGWGSEGDLRPLVALAAELRRAGHTVSLLLTPVDGTDYGPLCSALDLPLTVLPARLELTLDQLAGDAQSLDPLRVSKELSERLFAPFLDPLYEAALERCAGSDVCVWHYACWYAKAAALKSRVPDVAVHFYPGLVPTRERPPGGLPNLGPLNPLLWSVARAALDLQFRKRPAAFFASKDLAPIRHVLPDALFSEHLNLHAFSPRVCPPGRGWGPRHQVVGQLVLPEAAEPWRPSPSLSAFLDRGDRPVLLALGSMEHLAPSRARELLTGAAREAGVRAIIQSKRWKEERTEGDLHFLPRAPHDALLRHCAAMVHHGGAGTVHTALRAGVPSLAVPFILEQRVWGELANATGAGAPPVPFWKATPRKLGRAIRQLVASEASRTRAAELSRTMQQESGVRSARRLLEELVERSASA